MVETGTGYLTEQGQKLFAKMNAGTDSITYTRIVFSSDNLSDETEDQITQTVDLKNQQISLPSQSYPDSDGVAHIRVVGNNQNTKDGFYVNTYGVYAKGEDGQELLYGVSCDNNPAYITPFDGISPQSLSYEWKLKVSRTDKINFDATNAIYATIDDLQKFNDTVIKEISSFNVDNVDHNFTKSVQRNGIDLVDKNQLSTAIGNFNGDDKDHNFTAKLQHNGNDIVDIETLNKTIDNFSGDDKDHNFTAGLQYHGVQVATQQDVQNALVNKRGDFDQGRSLNELIGDYGVYDINNHDLANYKDNQGLPTDAGDIYGAVIPFAGTGFTTIFVFMANGRTFVAPRSQYVNTAFTELANTNYVDSSSSNAYQNAVNTAKSYTDSSHVLGMPTQAMQKGDAYDNYAGKYVHLDIDGLNIFTDIADGLGLPNQQIWGEFISIPNHNVTTQIINDNLGNSWHRIAGKVWEPNVPTTFTNSEQDAINHANNSVAPALFVYPTDSSTTNAYKHVLGIYAFGTDGQSVINLTIPNTNEFQSINAYATYNSSNQTITLHGSIQAISAVNVNDNVFSIEIDNLNMNEITSDYLAQPVYSAFNMQTDTSLKNVIAPTNFAQPSGYVWNLEGTTITLGYDASLQPKFDPNNVLLNVDPTEYTKQNAYATYNQSNRTLSFFGKIRPNNYPSFDAQKPIFYVDVSTLGATNATNVSFNTDSYSVQFSENKVYLYPTPWASPASGGTNGFDMNGGQIQIS